MGNWIWKSGITLPDSGRMPLKASQNVRSAKRPCHAGDARVQTPYPRQKNVRFQTDFQLFDRQRWVNMQHTRKPLTQNTP